MATPVPYQRPELDPAVVFDMGVNAPIYHQRVIALLTAGLYPLYRSGTIPYEPLPEITLTEGYSTPTPDLICYDHKTEQTRLILEVCQTNGQKHDLHKVIRLIDSEDYGIQEGFVYNYKTQQWLRYQLGGGGAATATSVSTVLDLDLNELLH